MGARLAPGHALRRWYGHRPERLEEFRGRYVDDLREQAGRVAELRRRSRLGRVTLVFAAREVELSHAAVLARVIRRGFPRTH